MAGLRPKRPRRGETCPCCREPLRTIVLDHDHATGAIRDYVCASCNKLLGQIENRLKVKDRFRVEYLMIYIQKHNGAFDYVI
jgi:hypothetical protein